jgi:hypothetical protein
MTANLDKIKALATKYQNKGRQGQAIGELFTPEDAGTFAALTSQGKTVRYYQLAESRLQRDSQMLLRMKKLAETDHSVGLNMSKETDPEFKPYLYMYSMRTVLKDVKPPPKPSEFVCSFDLAMDRDAGAAVAEMSERMKRSKEVVELLTLRSKYQVPDGAEMDSNRLTTAERTRLPALLKATGAILRGQSEYQENILGLRFFADVSQLMYEWQTEDILKLGAAGDLAEYDQADAARYAKLSPTLQQGVNVWHRMDKDFPSLVTKTDKQMNESKKASLSH